METCAKCGGQTVCAHSFMLDGARIVWRLCCLCTAELINTLSGVPQAASNG